ncbi:MAG TPA: DNA translocase FtsK, partial [Terracidiphilus sp.]|nr:DNA translocase FtsK [Terracidiphilus sp.]
DQRLFTSSMDEAATNEPTVKKPFSLASLFRRKDRSAEIDPVDDIPAYQRVAAEAAQETPAAAEPVPMRRNIWEPSVAPAQVAQMPVAPVTPAPAARPVTVPAQVVEMRAPRVEPVAAPVPAPTPAAPPAPQTTDIAIHERADAEERTATVAPKHLSGFKLPASTLLNAGSGPQAVREDELRTEARALVEKCAEFDVRGQVVQINPGPMVTTYEFKPEAGVKYSRVTSLAEDLCLAMRAESILIERMAGKSTVGIQVPNRERETIHLRDVLESETFSKAKSRLTLAMGKDINGRIVTADLASMPHVLIAGSTGSGKSVAINAMIMSLLFRTTPNQVRLILVDPKRVELGMYEGIPHLFTPIITEPKLAANALRNAVREMERRLKLLASRSVRNIDQYNKLFEGAMPSLFDDGEQEEPLPYIVIIIDELADLMMLDRANVEESITRLAQMARAVGIHLVLATQRPSVDVITGLIKANVPTRISFRLATKVDSRTIIDTNGAEALLGRGDMLFLPPGTSRLMRLHAPYVSEKETAAVVNFWKEQGAAEYAEGFLDSPKDERPNAEGGAGDGEDDDPMFDDAVRLVFEFGKASTSLLQRRLRIGYGRAAHLIDMMERDGLVGPADGSRPRELLKAPGWLHEVSMSEE